MYKYLLIPLIFLLYSCSTEPNVKNENSCACEDLQLDALYNHFFLENRKEPYTGFCITKDKTGNILEKRNYIEGKVDGTLTKYFEGGNVKSESNYVRNMQHGDLKQWDEQGNLLLHCIYSRGELDTILIDNR